MYTPPLKNRYSTMLSDILGSTKNMKSSLLLQAYATFSAMLSTGQNPMDAYKSVRDKYADYPHALLRLPAQVFKNTQTNTLADFISILSLPLLYFIFRLYHMCMHISTWHNEQLSCQFSVNNIYMHIYSNHLTNMLYWYQRR